MPRSPPAARRSSPPSTATVAEVRQRGLEMAKGALRRPSLSQRRRWGPATCPRSLKACEVGGDDRRAAVAKEGAAREADADPRPAGAEQIGAVLEARETLADDRRGLGVRAAPPGE